MTLFTAHITIGDECFCVDYDSVDACITDKILAKLLDDTSAEVILQAGELRITGSPLRKFQELKEALVSNANVILRELL